MTDESSPLLSVRGLKKHYPLTSGIFRREVGRIRAVDGVDFALYPGETLGIIGESGCGKSTTALSTLRLEEPTAGTIRFDGKDVQSFSKTEMRRYRRRVQLVLQDPADSFNPRIPVGQSVGEPLLVHGMDDSERRRAIVEVVLERVGLDASAADQYPHAFSGGEKQRIALARALVLNPDIIVADEPVSALDGETKMNVLSLLEDIQQSYDISILFISHDIDTVRRFCDRVAVMYLGQIVERGPVPDILDDPDHPYTRLLKSSIPDLDPDTALTKLGGNPLTDMVPEASDPPTGCRFHPRCRSIIQPDDVSLPTDEWHRIIAFSLWLRGLDPDESTQTEEFEDHPAIDRLPSPKSIADPTIASVLEETVTALNNDDISTAQRTIAPILISPCERSEPHLQPGPSGWEVSCHHYTLDE